MDHFRIGFVTGIESWWRNKGLSGKYFKMRLEGYIYPDVYSLPHFFTSKYDFLRLGEKIPPGRYEILFAELQGSDIQLEYLEQLVSSRNPPVAVIPGPPEILLRDLTHKKKIIAKRILSEARHIWAYSDSVRSFYDDFAGMKRAAVIPWPFDYKATVKLGRVNASATKDTRKILFQVPLRFSGVTGNHPVALKEVLKDVLGGLPGDMRKMLIFHTFVYSREDREIYRSSNFADGLPMKLERRGGYIPFVRFVGGCDAVVNLTAGSILGRVTFLGAALGKPGIFSSNAEINRFLYPNSVVELLDTGRFRDLLSRLISGLLDNRVDDCFHPCAEAAEETGDFSANAAKMRRLLSGDRPCAG
jgi:hypothetical protein